MADQPERINPRPWFNQMRAAWATRNGYDPDTFGQWCDQIAETVQDNEPSYEPHDPHDESKGGRLVMHPIVYEPVRNTRGKTVGWKVPERERERWDASEQIQREINREIARHKKSASSSGKETDPFTCPGCNGPLMQYAIDQGFRYCSRSCRVKHMGSA